MPIKMIEELRELGADELRARLADAEEELANLRFQHGSGSLESPIRVRQQRRNVARIRTLLNEALAKSAAEQASADEKA